MTASSSTEPVDQMAGAYDPPGSRDSSGLNLTGLWTLYALTLRQHLHGKRWMIMALLFLLPAALAFVAVGLLRWPLLAVVGSLAPFAVGAAWLRRQR